MQHLPQNVYIFAPMLRILCPMPPIPVDFPLGSCYNKQAHGIPIPAAQRQNGAFMNKRSKTFFWAALLLFSLVGQVAWVMENMYLNVFIYKVFAATPADISLMVGASAVTATVTTILIGALSDRIGKRKLFICGGYIAWGISILAFALVRMDVLAALFPATLSAASAGVALVILLDCVITFFGSSANDAAFNAWLTDSTDDSNRGAAEGLNAMMPLVAILAVFGGFMFLDLNLPESWTVIFCIIGGVVILIGITGILLIKDPAIVPAERGYLRQVLYGFSPASVRENRGLYLTLSAFTVFNISIQIFMPYLIIYYEVSLGMADYVFIMAPAIVLASVATALWGRVFDKKGFRFSVLLPLLSLLAGYALLFVGRTTVPVFVGSLFMMCGYLAGAAAFGARVRENTPAGKAGGLQGVRIFTQVLLPGVIGPFIGKQILADAETVVGGDGTESFIPSADIFLGAAVPALLLLILLAILAKGKPRRHERLTTPYEVGTVPWNEHPDPQMKRASFINLNGEWQLHTLCGGKAVYDGPVTVPFPPESELSGVGLSPSCGVTHIYRRTFTVDAVQGRLLLHIGAADTTTTVAVNDFVFPTPHEGGYLPITLDITEHVHPGENALSLHVRDPLDPVAPHGKQARRPGGMWYTPVSGIWQTVWLEEVPSDYIRSLKITPTLRSVTVTRAGGATTADLILDGRRYPFDGDTVTVELDDPHLWTPEVPHLYRFAVEAGEDRVESYFALREIGTKEVMDQTVLTLNGEPYFFHGLLDQGYFPDGLFLPASPEGYADDIRRAKDLGFNMLRKHIKIEPPLFYYYCDLYGMAVFQDMVNNGKYRFFYDTALPTVGLKSLPKRQPKAVRDAFYATAEGTLEHLYNHPSIVYYTIFNEGWGQHDARAAYERLKPQDPTRLFDTASGWFGREPSDVQSEHVYFKKADFRCRADRPAVLSEFGGYSCNLEGHVFNTEKVYGYKKCPTPEDLTRDLERLYLDEIVPLIGRGLGAAVLTQISDVEDETNGLLTYDRRVVKPDPAVLRAVADRLRAAFDERCAP